MGRGEDIARGCKGDRVKRWDKRGYSAAGSKGGCSASLNLPSL